MRSFVRNLFLVTLILLAPAKNLVAQDIPEIKPEQKSVLLFDFLISDWLVEAKAAKLDISLLDEPFSSGPLKGFKLNQMKRVFGSASLPKNFEAVSAMLRGGVSTELPFEIFVQIQFQDAQAVEDFEATARKDSKVVSIGGKKFLQSKEIGPTNFVFRRFDETTFEFGTIAYCQQDKRVFLSDRLKELYKTVPKHSFRFAIELETPSDFVGEAIELGRRQFKDPIVDAYFDLAERANSIVASQSLSAEELLTLVVAADDATDAEQIREGIESALGTLRLLGRGKSLGLVPGSGPDQVLDEIVRSLEAVHEQNLAKVIVQRPEGLAAALNEFQTIRRRRLEKVEKLNRFRRLGLACRNFEAAYQAFPFNYKGQFDEGVSWRVKILPFVDEIKIYQAMDLRKTPQDVANSMFATQMPEVFGAGGALSSVGWIKSQAKNRSDITDGSFDTVMLIETPQARPWLSANPLTVDEAIEMVSGLPDGEELVIAMYNGAAKTIDNSIDKKMLRFLFEPADGNVIPEFAP